MGTAVCAHPSQPSNLEVTKEQNSQNHEPTLTRIQRLKITFCILIIRNLIFADASPQQAASVCHFCQCMFVMSCKRLPFSIGCWPVVKGHVVRKETRRYPTLVQALCWCCLGHFSYTIGYTLCSPHDMCRATGSRRKGQGREVQSATKLLQQKV